MYLVLGGLEGEYPEPSVAAVGSFLVVCEDLVDGVRLNIDGKLVINGWMNQAYTTYTYRTTQVRPTIRFVWSTLRTLGTRGSHSNWFRDSCPLLVVLNLDPDVSYRVFDSSVLEVL